MTERSLSKESAENLQHIGKRKRGEGCVYRFEYSPFWQIRWRVDGKKYVRSSGSDEYADADKLLRWLILNQAVPQSSMRADSSQSLGSLKIERKLCQRCKKNRIPTHPNAGNVHGNARYCDECRPIVKIERNRNRKNLSRIGVVTDNRPCLDCGTTIEPNPQTKKIHGNAKRCIGCRKKAAEEDVRRWHQEHANDPTFKAQNRARGKLYRQGNPEKAKAHGRRGNARRKARRFIKRIAEKSDRDLKMALIACLYLDGERTSAIAAVIYVRQNRPKQRRDALKKFVREYKEKISAYRVFFAPLPSLERHSLIDSLKKLLIRSDDFQPFPHAGGEKTSP